MAPGWNTYANTVTELDDGGLSGPIDGHSRELAQAGDGRNVDNCASFATIVFTHQFQSFQSACDEGRLENNTVC